MPRFIDISGEKFGRLTALYRLHNYHKTGTHWLCICECGNLTEVECGNLKNGHTKSCGCSHKGINSTHKKSNTKIYRIWAAIKRRCYNKNCKDYKDYGSRRIVVCDKWKNDFDCFYNWAIENDYKEGSSIDRIDVNGNYEPSNCRWATPKQQARNRRSNKNITYQGETKSLAEWCEILNLNYGKVLARLRYGWSPERAFEFKK